jgi:hypothetical protein
LFAPLQYDSKIVVIIAHSLQYHIKITLSCKRQHKKPTVAKKQSHMPTTLHVAGVFDLIFLGKNSKTISITMENV